MLQHMTVADCLLPGVPRIESAFFGEVFGDLGASPETLRIARDLHGRFDWGTWLRQGGSMRIQDAWSWYAGAPHVDRSRTRWSQMTHYYFDDYVYYTPMRSNPAAGVIAYRRLRDVATCHTVPNRHAGGTLDGGLVRASQWRAHGGAVRYAWCRLRTLLK